MSIFVENVQLLLPLKFSLHRVSQIYLIDNQPEAWVVIFVFLSIQNQKLGRRHCELASCRVSSNFVQWLQRRS